MLNAKKRNIVVIGASAGGLEPIIDITEQLVESLEAAVFVVQHMPSYAVSDLATIIGHRCPLRVVQAEDGMMVESGRVYCAPPDRYLLLEDDRIILSKGPKENRFRPSIDALFRSAAYTYRERVIGVVLSGALNDGSAGMCTIKRLHGLALTQLPEEALFDSMPLEVEKYTTVDYSLTAAELGRKINELVYETPATRRYEISPAYERHLELEIDIAKNKNALQMGVFENGKFTPLTCPDCKGALVQIDNEKVLRFRCHTGHAYTADALLAGVTENIESDLWKVMRGMEEGYFVLNRIGAQMKDFGLADAAEKYYEQAAVLREKSEHIHKLISKTETLSSHELETAE